MPEPVTDPKRSTRARAARVALAATIPLATSLSLFGPGCAAARPLSAEVPRRSAVEVTAAPEPPPPPDEPDVPEGVFHRVERGQTAWRIARAYGVPLEVLLAENGIDDPRKVEVGRLLFVPGSAVTRIVPPYPAPPPPRIPSPSDVPGATPAPPVPASGPYLWPVEGGPVMSRYGAPRRGRRHAGLDIRGPKGQDILATRTGEVVFSGSSLRGYGKTVILDHGDGVESLYSHASELLVQEGDRVEQGQPVARIGRTGNATADHCHFEIRKDRVPVDPLPHFPEIARAAGPAPEAVASGGRATDRRARRSRSGGSGASAAKR